MNKVVSIEIAGQVFWIDEDAYEDLRVYLQKIKAQLQDDECADEIYQDIELRIAELLYGLHSDEKKAITQTQLEQVIEQVGFIEGEEEANETDPLPRKSYLEPQNKILAGVCAGLATRFKVPAFIIRVVFLALTAVFGLGVVLYLIFWFSLAPNSNRNSALAAQGKARTAKQIAAVESPKESPLNTLQRIIFLPFSIIGTLLSVIGNHFRNRKSGYWMIAKNFIAAGLLFLTVIFSLLVYEFNHSRMFSTFSAWILSACAIYIVVLILAIYWKEFYLSKPRTKVNKRLKQGAFVPAVVFILSITFLNLGHREHEEEYIEKEFQLKNSFLNLEFDEQRIEDKYSETVTYQVINRNNASDKLVVKIEYSASGKTLEEVKQNIQTINYEFNFDGETLALDKYWTLEDDAINRSQNVNVTIEVPQNIMLRSNRVFDVWRGKQGYSYTANHHYRSNSKPLKYITTNGFVHEVGEDNLDKLSDNERQVLNNKFCEEFFIGDNWSCPHNIRNAVDDNYRFDKAFEGDAEKIDKIREYLLPDRSLFASNLNEIKQLIQAISIEYSTKSKLQAHIEHLIKVKYQTDFLTANSKATDEASR